MSDIKVGGYGPGGCTCSITAVQFCRVHGDAAPCSLCKQPLGDERRASGPNDAVSHARCAKRATAHGIELTKEQADEIRRELGIDPPARLASSPEGQEQK